MSQTTAPRSDTTDSAPEAGARQVPGLRRKWRVGLAVAAVAALASLGAGEMAWRSDATPATPLPPPPRVTVSLPLRDTVTSTTTLLGQFSAVDAVELRAQVGGTLTAIKFQDGQIVHKGEPLFEIDPRPFQIRRDEAIAQLQSAEAREALTQVELWRAQQLKQTDFGSLETVDQRAADQRSAQAAIDTAKAAVRDALLDLEFSRVDAPFTGRIGAHLVSVGSLVSGSRGGAGPSTLLATIVSLDPIHIDFDMSEADYRAYQRAHAQRMDGQGRDWGAGPRDDVAISLDGDDKFNLHGTLDFIDNAVNRSSGTIHARATVANPGLAITPGQFARVRVPIGLPAPALLLPAAAVVPDQSRQVVMTVSSNGTIVPKPVKIGGLHHGLRVIRGGLAATDSVVIDGIVRVKPGATVTPTAGTIVANADSYPE
jgi:RND family efflux transporter MFP subunit